MKKLLVVLACAVLLSACSSKPSAKDAEKALKEVWAPCKLVEVADVEKTNGRDRGEYYDLAVSYKLVLTQDVTAENAFWGVTMPDPVPSSAAAYYEWNDRRNAFFEKNCPAPVIKRVLGFIRLFQEKAGTPLRKGDSVKISDAEMTMYKTEKGWMALK